MSKLSLPKFLWPDARFKLANSSADFFLKVVSVGDIYGLVISSNPVFELIWRLSLSILIALYSLMCDSELDWLVGVKHGVFVAIKLSN
jgi:hypothetical protein